MDNQGIAMKTKKMPPPQSESKRDPKALKVNQQPSEGDPEAMARTSLRPTVQAALTLMDFNKAFGELSISTLVDDLGKQCELASSGDLKRAEAILTAQAHTLDAIFHNLARRAQRAEYINQLEANLRLALKAQSQCRSTLETLAAIKNPQPVAFVKQANISHGPQQVNNGETFETKTRGRARARENENQQNELLEHNDGKRLDTGATGAAGGVNQKLEAMGGVNRTSNQRG